MGAETKYDFGLSHHGDVVLKKSDEVAFNFGYNYTDKFPFVPWLHNLQVEKRDIFDNLEIPLIAGDGEIILDSALEMLIEELGLLKNRLPLSPDEFNEQLIWLRLSDFNDGNNRLSYSWKLEGNILCLSQRRREPEVLVLQLSSDESRQFALDYFNLLEREQQRVVAPRMKCYEVIRRLRER
ncbi:MAG: hypothetical protein WC796_06180 [Candidatus Pacearchaeota archaeon]|jgi:hypothetical protein